ncbi:hypothetical protein [Arthrobacter sp. HMWF013]|uniref:hypothetical protein n=1 Tax=Arthrobacter sp. HMWF013 TaxID=2056849 RepID=UPI000D39E5B8|nr:hypothetical protein [Arthrobacter sp. HMWF013]PTT69174.1 hypothetical protein DBR22_04580 [Arthrobacter sp. HMWF013]
MRTVVSAVAVILGVVLAALAVPAIWLDRHVVQEDGFVALAAPLGSDDEFQQRLAAAAIGTIDTSAVPEVFAGLLDPVLEAAAESLTGLPGYPAAWEETLRRSHRLSFAEPGTLPAEVDSSTALTLDVAPLVALGMEELSRTSGLPLDPPGQTLINVGQANQRQLIEQAAAYAPLGYSLAIGSGIALLLALVAARRRWVVVFSTGIGGLLIAGLWAAGSQLAGDTVLATTSGNEIADMFKNEFAAAATASFRTWTLAAAIAGVALAVVGIVVRIASPGRRGSTR